MAASEDEKVRPSPIAAFRQWSTFEKEAGGLSILPSIEQNGDSDTEKDGKSGAANGETGEEKASESTATQRRIKRADRRGLCGRFTVLAEIEDPYTYSRRVKWFITSVVAVAAAAAPLGSAILYRTLHVDFLSSQTLS